MGRLVAMVLIAVVLLAAVAAATYLVQRPTKSAAGQPTQTATTASATNTSTTSGTLTTCDVATNPPTIGTDLKCLLDPPNTAATQTLNDPSPLCDGQAQWSLENNATHTCGSSTGVTLAPIDATSNALACLDDRAITQADGFVSVNVSRQSGGVALGFREAFGEASGANGNFIQGYYFLITSSTGAHGPLDHYQLTVLDAQGHTHIAGQPSALPETLAQDFELGVSFKGNQIKLSINSVALATIQDSTLTTGWVGMCGYQGSSMFQAFQVYELAS
jgi:hypothetical protein